MKQSISKSRHKKDNLSQICSTTGQAQQQVIDVDLLAKEKIEEVEKALNNLTNFKLDSFNSWLSILKQIITAADLHRTNDSKNRGENGQVSNNEVSDSIYADYGDDNEQFNAHVDLSEQLATNSVKWTVRVQAFKLVHRLIQLLNSSSKSTTKLSLILLKYLPDLVRLAFVAATSPYDELKMQGFEMFRFLVEKFASVEEEECPGHSILEQYKTQVLSAVKPAFNFDAPPYITAIASQICSLWICHGMEREISDVKRTYQLMLLSIEKLDGQGLNHHSKLYTESELEKERLDIIGSWAQLYISSMEFDLLAETRLFKLSNLECQNLKNLVKTQLDSLVDKWWEALRDYALLIMPAPKFIGLTHDNENVYTREVALKLFSSTWPKLVLALAVWLCKDSYKNTTKELSDNTQISNCDNLRNSPKSRKETSMSKYTQFLCGIIMKELSSMLQILQSSRSNRQSIPLMSDSGLATLKSLYIILCCPDLQSIFSENLAIAREFYSTLYCIAVSYNINHSTRLLLNEILDKLFHLILDKVCNQETNLHYGLAKLMSSLMTTMKNIAIACKEESHTDLNCHRVHFSLQLKNLVKIIEFASKLALNEDSLQEALISVIQEMLQFDLDWSVSSGLADQLANIYPALSNTYRTRMIDELFPELLNCIDTNIEHMNKMETSSELRKLKLSQLEMIFKSIRATVSNASPADRIKLIDSTLITIIKRFSHHYNKPNTFASEYAIKKEKIYFCVDQIKTIKSSFPVEFEMLKEDTQKSCDLLLKLQQDSKSEEKSKLSSSKEMEKPVCVNSSPKKPQKAKITLKVDFSNFYAKKQEEK